MTSSIKIEVKDKGYITTKLYEGGDAQGALETVKTAMCELKNEVLVDGFKLTPEQAESFEITYDDENELNSLVLSSFNDLTDEKGILGGTSTFIRLTATSDNLNKSLDFLVWFSMSKN